METDTPETQAAAYPFSSRAKLSRGQAIGTLMAQALAHPHLVSLAAGFVDSASLPCEAVGRSLAKVLADSSRAQAALQYDSTAGSLTLRKAIAEWSNTLHPEAAPAPERVILTAGSNQFLALISEAILDPGDIVLVALPTYFVYLGTLRSLGANIVGVPADEDGMCIDALEERLAQLAAQGQADRVKAIYMVTEFDNPASSTLSGPRRRQLLEVVQRWRATQGPVLVLSDNAYSELRYAEERQPSISSLASEAREFVIEIGTFSKSFSPGVRVGWGVVPDAFIAPLLDLKSNLDFGSPHFSQVLLNEVIRSGELEAHLPVIRSAYQRKLDAMLAALTESFGQQDDVHWRTPTGGLYVWLTFPERIDTSEKSLLWAKAVEEGVLYVPGYHCFPQSPVSSDTLAGANTIRLSFGVQSEQGIRDGIRKLASAYRATIEQADRT